MIRPTDPALEGAIAFYSASIYPRFDEIGPTAAQEAAEAAGLWMLEQAPVRGRNGEFPKKDIPHFGEKSIIFAIALGVAYIVWKFQAKGSMPSPLFDAAMEGWHLYQLDQTTPPPTE